MKTYEAGQDKEIERIEGEEGFINEPKSILNGNNVLDIPAGTYDPNTADLYTGKFVPSHLLTNEEQDEVRGIE